MRTWNSYLEGAIQGSWWLFEVTTTEPATYKWSLGAYTDYTQQIITDSFAGIELVRNRAEFGIVAPSTVNFAIHDAAGAFTDASIFIDASVTIRLYVKAANGTTYNPYTWAFNVQRCDGGRGRLDFICTDFLTRYLKGTWPNTPLISSLVQEETAGKTPGVNPKDLPDDNVCVPVTVGTAYIPLRSIFLGDAYGRQYVMGPAVGTYTVAECHSPSDGANGNSQYLATDFDLNQATFELKGNNYRMLAPLIALNDDGVTYDVGIWPGMKDMPCRFSNSGTVSLTNPVDWIKYVLLDFGVPAGRIGDTSFTAAAATITTMGITVEGGYWFARPRQEILAELLNSCHCCLDVTDKVAIRVLSEAYDVTYGTITTGMVIKDAGRGDGFVRPEALLTAFKYSPITQVNNDAAYVSYPQDLDADGDPLPQDKLIKVLVPVGTSTPENISSDTLTLSLVKDSVDAQKLATMYFERRFLRSANISHKLKPAAMALQPDDVIHYDNAYFGGTYDALIESVKITPQLAVEVAAVRYSQALSTWAGMTFDAITVAADGTATSATWQTITAGPISYPSKGDAPNCLPGKLVIGTAGQVVLDPTITAGVDWRILVGSLDPASAKFRVDEEGNLFCDSVTEMAANIVQQGRFELARDQGDWSGGTIVAATTPTGASFTKALRVEEQGVVEGPYRKAVTGDILYFSCWLDTTSSLLPVYFGVQTKDTSGVEGKYAPDVCTLSAGQGWAKVTGSMVVPDDIAYFAPVVSCDGTYASGSFDVAEMIISRHQLGATVGAEFGYSVYGGGADYNQVGNDGMITKVTAGIVQTGALISTNYDATHGISFNLDTAVLEVNEAGGLVVNAAGGISVSGGGGIDIGAGGDISLHSTSTDDAYLKFFNAGTGSGYTYVATGYDAVLNGLYTGSSGGDGWFASGWPLSTAWALVQFYTVGTTTYGALSAEYDILRVYLSSNSSFSSYRSFEMGGRSGNSDRGFRTTESDTEYFGGRHVNSGGVFTFKEVSSAPGSLTGEGQLYTKSDNILRFMDGDGNEHSVSSPKAMISPEGGFMTKMVNRTGASSVKGTVVTISASYDDAVEKIVVDVPSPIGVIYDSGIADGSDVWVVTAGKAEVYVTGNTNRKDILRGFITGDSGYVSGQALAEAYPTAPFASDKHFYEIGHAAASRTGAGLVLAVLHFN